jgi:2',3'-cyclic-nucleotide 2'-phosphodiesterase (5'-nucleotidase family)
MKRCLCVLLLLTVAVAGCRRGAPAAARALTLLASSDELGEIADCGCVEQPSGGLARRIAYVRQVRTADPARSLAIEAGDFLADDLPRTDEGRQTAAERARLIARAYRDAGYDAALFGKRDLALGLPLVRELAAVMDVRALGANVRDRAANRELWPPPPIIQRRGVAVALLGLVGPPTAAEAQEGFLDRAGIEIEPPVAAAQRLLPELRKQADIVVLVANMNRATLADVLAQAKGVDFVLQSGEASAITQRVEIVHGAPVATIFRGGRFVGRFEIALTEPGRRFAGSDDRQLLERKIKRYREYLDALAREAGGADKIAAHFAGQPDVLAQVARYGKDIETWRADLSELHEKGNRYSFELVELTPEFGEDAAVARAVADFAKAHPPAHTGG